MERYRKSLVPTAIRLFNSHKYPMSYVRHKFPSGKNEVILMNWHPVPDNICGGSLWASSGVCFPHFSYYAQVVRMTYTNISSRYIVWQSTYLGRVSAVLHHWGGIHTLYHHLWLLDWCLIIHNLCFGVYRGGGVWFVAQQQEWGGTREVSWHSWLTWPDSLHFYMQ